MKVLLTGATGYLGSRILRTLLAQADVEVICLCRSRGSVSASQRVGRQLEGVEDSVGARVQTIEGNLKAPGLGLSDDDRERLLSELDQVIHCAAVLDFSLGLDQLRECNVEATRQLLALTRQMRERGRSLRLFSYISTAYVAGEHRNAYEQTKAEAEALVAQCTDTPTVIHRPSIIWDDPTAPSKRKKSLLDMLVYLYASWPFKVFPAGQTRLDIVPVDYVARAVVAGTQHPSRVTGRTLALVAGPQRSVTARRLIKLIGDELGRSTWVVPPLLYFVFIKPVLSRHPKYRAPSSSPWKAYFYGANPRFDHAETEQVLSECGVEGFEVEAMIRQNTHHALAGTRLGVAQPSLRAQQASK